MSQPRRKSSRFKDRAELLDYLLEVATVTSQTLELDRLLADVAKVVLRVIPAQLFAILLHSDRQKALRIRYSMGHRQELVDRLVIPLGEGITGKAAETREPILVRDVRKEQGYLNAMDAVRCEMAIPMIVRDKLVGVIDFQSTEIGAYTVDDMALTRLIAMRVGYSIDNARLYRRVDQQHRTLRTLSKTSQGFSSILDVDELLHTVAGSVRALMDYDSFIIWLLDEQKQILRKRFAISLAGGRELDEVPLSIGVTGSAARLRRPMRVEDTLADPRYIASHPTLRSEVAVPLMLRDRVIGVMDLESSRLNYYSVDHMRTLTLLAPQVASAIENARLYEELAEREQRMEDDMQAARKLQSLLLPSEAPEIDGLDIAVGVRPARDITGDLFDFFDYDNGQATIVFGDSSGKGPAAALYAALVSGLLRSLGRRPRTPADLLHALNNALTERRAEAQYVTLAALFWDAPTRRLTIANAGGLPPIICRGDVLLDLDAEGVPVGLLEARVYDEKSADLQRGDVVVLTSDGILDAMNERGEEYGRERLGQAIQAFCHLPVKEIVKSLYAAVQEFSGSAPQFDDQTVLILRVS
ncbi:MAG TPA: SpoIIE family protein phosphatase [Bryobacteraceae bacterium]|nr:SpoIIE family protein phosphatase [Bryobacteraceae bacterium]